MSGGVGGTGLSVRAANVLHNIGIDIRRGPEFVAAALGEAADAHARTVDTHLMYQRHAGPVTRREILGWCGLTTEPALHVCTCRTCGKTFGKSFE